MIDLSKLEQYLNDISIETKKIHRNLESANATILKDSDSIGSLKYSVIVIAEAIAHTLHHILAKEHNISISGYKEFLLNQENINSFLQNYRLNYSHLLAFEIC